MERQPEPNRPRISNRTWTHAPDVRFDLRGSTNISPGAVEFSPGESREKFPGKLSASHLPNAAHRTLPQVLKLGMKPALPQPNRRTSQSIQQPDRCPQNRNPQDNNRVENRINNRVESSAGDP